MKKSFLPQEQQDSISRSLHRGTITMALVILVMSVMILPWSNPYSAAFIPLILSMVISFFTLVWATISLRRQIRKEMLRR